MTIMDLCAIAVPVIFLVRFFMKRSGRAQIINGIYVLISTLTLIARYVQKIDFIVYALVAIILLGIIILLSWNDASWSEHD